MSNTQLRGGAILSYLSIGVNILLGILYTPWMIGEIGKSDYGLYILVTSFISYFVMDFGLGNALARYITKYKADNEDDKVRGLLGISIRIYLFIDLLILVVLSILYFFLENIFVELSIEEIEKFKVVYLIAVGFGVLSFPFSPIDGILIAYKRFVFLKAIELISKLSAVLLIVLVLLLGLRLYTLVTINAGVILVVGIIKAIFLIKKCNLTIDWKYRNRSLLYEVFKYSFWISIIGIAQRLLVNIAPTVLGIVSGTQQISIFSVGVIIEGYVWTIAHALNGLFLPKVTELVQEDSGGTKVTNLMIKVGRFQLMLMGLILIGIITLGKSFLTVWMGAEFLESYYVILFLILPGFITLTQEIAYTYLFVVNEIKFRAILFITASILSFLLSFYFGKQFGAIGVSMSIFTALMLCHVVGMNLFYWKKLKLEIPRFFKECYLNLLIPFGLTALSGIYMELKFTSTSMSTFLVKCLILTLIYFLSVWFLGMSSEEKQTVKSLMKR